MLIFDGAILQAHKNVFNVLLQVLDDGRLTDGKGRTVDFTNCVIIMTSNLGAHALLEGTSPSGILPESTKQRVMDAVRGHFRPEFINRLDDIVIFSPLTRDQLRKIVDMQVLGLQARLKEKEIILQLESSGADTILELSYNPQYGARPIRRFVEKQIGTAISRQIISGDITKNTRVTISGDSGKLRYVTEELSADAMEIL